jgi:hypothetical protein
VNGLNAIRTYTGEIVEYGTHFELLSVGGAYARLCHDQMLEPPTCSGTVDTCSGTADTSVIKGRHTSAAHLP